MRGASKSSVGRAVALAAALLFFAGAAAEPTSAQSIGLEAGVASVESFAGVRPALGISLFLPLTERLRLGITGSQWTGCPTEGCDEPRNGYGNRGLNVLGLFNAFDGGRTDVSLGAGLGWYEMKRPDEGGSASESYYDEAFTFAVEVRRAVAYNSGLYLRGESSFPTDDGGARWGSLRLGADVRVF